MSPVIEQQIRERAFHLWEADGRPDGQADHHWLSAERELQSIMVAAAPKKRAPAKKAASPKPATQPRTSRSVKPGEAHH